MLIPSLSQLNKINYALNTWTGFVFVFPLIAREITVGLCIFQYDIENAEDIIRGFALPSRVQLCQHIQRSSSFPINALRNLAIQNTHTTHLFVADVDIIPSRPSRMSLSSLANLRETFLSLPSPFLHNYCFAAIVPLFETYFYSQPCDSWATCGST